jgi:hypothetical protein
MHNNKPPNRTFHNKNCRCIYEKKNQKIEQNHTSILWPSWDGPAATGSTAIAARTITRRRRTTAKMSHLHLPEIEQQQKWDMRNLNKTFRNEKQDLFLSSFIRKMVPIERLRFKIRASQDQCISRDAFYDCTAGLLWGYLHEISVPMSKIFTVIPVRHLYNKTS